MRIFIILLFIFVNCSNPTNTVIKECVESHTELKSSMVLIGKVWMTQYHNENVCDKYDFIYYDETGAAWKIQIVKKGLWARP